MLGSKCGKSIEWDDAKDPEMQGCFFLSSRCRDQIREVVETTYGERGHVMMSIALYLKVSRLSTLVSV